MKNVVHSSKSSIIFEGGLNKYELKNNLFSNISWYFKSHSNDGEGYCQNGSGIFSQKSENCLFTYCESPYYGNILSIESFANSLIHNSSFIKCRTTRRVNFNCNFWNQNMVLEDVEFEVYCNVNDVKGGALYFKDNSAGTIRNCYFKNCTNGRNINDDDARGGAIYFDSTGSLKFIDSNCSNCTTNEGDGFLFICKGGSHSLSGSIFDTSKFLRYGGVTFKSISTSFSVDGCTFENGESTD